MARRVTATKCPIFMISSPTFLPALEIGADSRPDPARDQEPFCATGSGPLDDGRLVYLGLPLGALALCRAGHTIAAACISRPDFPGMRRLRRRLAAAQAPVFARPDLADPNLLRLLRST